MNVFYETKDKDTGVSVIKATTMSFPLYDTFDNVTFFNKGETLEGVIVASITVKFIAEGDKTEFDYKYTICTFEGDMIDDVEENCVLGIIGD